MRRRLLPPLAMLALGFRVAARERVSLAIGLGYYSLLIFLFAAVWRHTPFAAQPDRSITLAAMVWYIAVTELVTFSGMQFREQVRFDIQAQQLSGLMGLPLPYWQLKTMQLLGRGLLNFTILGLGGFVVAFLIAGGVPFPPVVGGAALVSGLLAMALTLTICFSIGLLDVWGQYARPVYWIWQKSLFVLGGLMLPLSLYPDWLRAAALWTPFPAMVSLPAQLVFRQDLEGFGAVVAQQLAWLALFAALALWLHGRVRRHIGAEGD